MAANDHEFKSVVRSEDDLPEAAAGLLKFAGTARIFLVNGEMGAGKTTFIKALCRQLGSVDHFSSPTFSLVNEYTSPQGKIAHLDLYRVKAMDELFDMGIEELLDSGNYCFIEWPDLIRGFPESAYVTVNIVSNEQQRFITAFRSL